MRIKVKKYTTPAIIILNIVVFIYVWKPSNKLKDYSFLIREFESFDNDLEATVNSIFSVHPEHKIFIITDDVIYPPVDFGKAANNCVIINQAPAFLKNHESREPLLQIKSKFIFIVPDSTILPPQDILKGMVDYLERNKFDFIALKHKSNQDTECLHVKVNSREWYVAYSRSKYRQICSIVKGKHLLLARTETLLKLSDPFMQPFPEALYLQTAALKYRVGVHTKYHVEDGRPLMSSKHLLWKYNQLLNKRRYDLYKTMGIKKVTNEYGNVEWYGCRKDTPRCFGTIVDDMPAYLFAGKWTPPCCLEALRKTALHVFKELEESKVRYWLEGGSLLGAFRSGNIIPWDYDIDIGIYLEDVDHNSWLRSAREKPTVDKSGFVWEKAVEGDFFRVQYSSVNHLHVDIFPFYSKNGTMTKNTWFKNHVQDKEFPESFLKPMSTILFLGHYVSAPNNIREFLEFKFGVNAINHPAYPNPSKLSFPHQG